jgi:hypothetical protein
MLIVNSELSEEGGPVTLDRRCGVLLGEAKIQRAFSITAGRTANPSGEPMDQPGQLLKSPDLQNVQLGFGSA